MLRRRLPEGSRESSLWDGWLESLMILRAFLMHRLCRCPGGREAHLQQCGGQFARPFAELCGCQRCCFQTRRWCSRSGCSPQCRCRMIWGCWGLFQTSSAVSRRRGADVPSSALHLCEQTMWDPRDVNAEELKAAHPLHRCLVDGDGCVFSALSSENPPTAPWSCRCWVRGGSPDTI